MRIWIGTWTGLAAAAIASPAIAGDSVPIGAIRLVQPVSIPVSPEFRLRVVVPPSDANWRMQGAEALTHGGGGGALVDFYPFDNRFHLSAGGRLFSRDAARSTDPASLQLLPASRVPGVRRRFTPAMLMGYSHENARGLSLGLDAGMMMGQSNPSPDYRLKDGPGPRVPTGLNGLARMTLRAPF